MITAAYVFVLTRWPALLTQGLAPGSSAAPKGATVCPGADCNDNTVSPGVLGFAVVVVMGVAVVFLLRSFRKHVGRVPPTFDDPGTPKA